MVIRNLHWYNENEGRAYPLDDTATCVTAAGDRLPANILCDANLRWPQQLGDYAFLASVSVTKNLVTLTFQAAHSLLDSNFAPLAVVAVKQPVQQGRVYAVQGQVPGVGGWVVFGSGVSEPTYQGRLLTPRDGLLTARAARPYRPLPVSSLGVANQASTLTGVVRLTAQEPLVIAAEERVIDGLVRDCVVVRLTDTTGSDGFAAVAGSAATSVFQQFAGPCAGRPESNSCGDPQPIEFVNGVPPDCDGVLTIDFTGHGVPSQLPLECGISVDCALGLVNACIPPQIPSTTGLLPGEYTPANIPPYPPPPPPPPPSSQGSESVVVLGGLPFVDCFTEGAVNFTTAAGLWDVDYSDDSPEVICPSDHYSVSVSYHLPGHSASHSYNYLTRLASLETATAASRNVDLWQGFDVQTVYRKVTTELKLLAGPAGALHNGCVVLNYVANAAVQGQDVYYLAEIDYDSQEFRISRWDGLTFLTVVPVSVPGIQLDKWYRIVVTVLPGPGAGTTITAELVSVTDPGQIDVTVSVAVNNYQKPDGWFGLGSDRALTRFGYFKVEEAHA